MAKQTITSGAGVLWSATLAKLNSMLTELYGWFDYFRVRTDSGIPSIVNGAAGNAIDSAVDTCLIAGGGRDSFPNLIGDPGAPVGADLTPPGWSDDTGYPAGAATVATIVGGYDHVNNQIAGTICGGGHNFIKYDINGHSIIGGGSYNIITGYRAGIFSGKGNSISAGYGFIGGGDANIVSGHYGAIPGGLNVEVSGDYSGAMGRDSTINGGVSYGFGQDLDIQSSYCFAGGLANVINSTFGYAFGRAITINHARCFVAKQGDSTPFATTKDNSCSLLFSGGYRLDINGVPVYANNAAATAGGLLSGELYRSGADPDALCIVH